MKLLLVIFSSPADVLHSNIFGYKFSLSFNNCIGLLLSPLPFILCGVGPNIIALYLQQPLYFSISIEAFLYSKLKSNDDGSNPFWLIMFSNSFLDKVELPKTSTFESENMVIH